MDAPKVYTYHCLCTSLLLASTHQLLSLPRRAPPAIDRAIILPLPPAPLPSETDADKMEDSEPNTRTGATQSDVSELGYTSLLSMTPDRRVTVIRREDGFEKRYLWRCGRCRLVVGYELDKEHSSGTAKPSNAGTANMEGVLGSNNKISETVKVIYLLPGGIMSTEVMAEGKKISEDDIKLVNISSNAVAVWE